MLMKKIKAPVFLSALIAGAFASITNTALVLSAIYLFGNMLDFYADAYELIKGILSTILTLNGGVELAASAILVPSIYTALGKPVKKYGLA